MHLHLLKLSLIVTAAAMLLATSTACAKEPKLQMNRSGKTPGQLSQKHQDYLARRNQRKSEALKIRQELIANKDYSRVGLSQRINIDITNPSGVYPWGNAYRPNPNLFYWYRGRWYRRCRRPVIVLPLPLVPCSPCELR